MSSDVIRLIKEGESETLEFKSGRAQVESVARTVCAFLNQQGGVVLWGVSEPGRVTGVDDGESLVRKLHEVVAKEITPSPLFSASVVPVSDKKVVVVDVPRGADKPYSLNREIWVRVGSANVSARPEQSVELVQRRAAEFTRWEREPLPGFGIDDCDREELSSAKAEIQRVGRFGIDVPKDDEELLRSLSLEHRGQLTNAAAVLFAATPRAWSPNWTLRIVSYVEDKSGPIANDTILSRPAVQGLREAIGVIQQRTGFSGEFERGRLERIDRPAYPLFALREGLVNAIVHRDYAVLGGDVRVEIFPTYLVIQNPGSLPEGWKPADLRKKHASRPTNPDIARVFYLRELMEQLGVGTQKLIHECTAMGAKSPTWKVEQGSVWLTLFRAPEPDIRIELSDRQRQFLEETRPGETYKPNDFTRITGVSERQARRDLGELQRFGLLEKRGKGPATVYVRIGKELPK